MTTPSIASRRHGFGVLRPLSLAVLITATGCSGGAPLAGSPSAFVDTSALPQLSPKVACASLAGTVIPASAIGLPTTGALITSATLVPASGEVVTATTVTHPIPEYCKVLGDIRPVDSAALPIKFQLNVPTSWNQKTIQVGGGGLDGSIPANLAAIGSSGSPISSAFPPDAPYPIARGYASFGGDSGHQDPGTTATWALNAESWTNFAHASLKKTHDAAFAVIQVMYGVKPRVSYFMGQSQGGREALEVAQRYPGDYDGIVATSPLIGYTAHVVAKTLLVTVQTGAGWIPAAKQAAIGAEVMRQCDGLDGVVDGMISNYNACAALFDPTKVARPFAAIRCAGGADTGSTCLSDAQIATINQMHAPTSFGYVLANGLSTFPGYGTGREGLSGWLNISPQPSAATQPALGQPGATVSYGILKDPAFNLANFSVGAFQDKIQAASALIDSTNPDLSRFFARGGRMIVKNNGSDYSSNPQTVMAWYKAMAGVSGQDTVNAHVRYYIAPNLNHSGDGVSTLTGEALPQYVDLITMATDWVEKNVTPPDAPMLSAKAVLPPYTVAMTRPMCRYPLYPRYTGSGDVRAATSFACVP